MKTIYLLQGGGRDEFPFFPEQPGNGNGNPPPFGEPTANIDAGIWLGLFIGSLIGIILILKKAKR